jgi:hypothetical protein
VTIWIERDVKAEVDQIARQEGLSVSATGAAFLTSLQEGNAPLDPETSLLLGVGASRRWSDRW